MKRIWGFLAILLLLGGAIAAIEGETVEPPGPEADVSGQASVILAGGCFWCVEADFEKLEGVIEAISGYTGGHTPDPKYKEVSRGGTGHVEAVKIVYDPDTVSFAEILKHFWRHIDPTDSGGQFVDRGAQYRPVLYYRSEEEKKIALESRAELARSGVFRQPIQTEIASAGKFYRAEEYHQDYYRKNPFRYKFYRYNSGRDQFLERAWKE